MPDMLLIILILIGVSIGRGFVDVKALEKYCRDTTEDAHGI